MRVLDRVDQPVSAYDIAQLAAVEGARLCPNQVYRTTARLIEKHQVRRVHTVNAYLASSATAELCMICEQCRCVEWKAMPSLVGALRELADARQIKFAPDSVEISGLCGTCREKSTAAASCA